MAMELPEAVTLARQMNETLRGKRIVEVDLKDCDSLIGQTFVNMHRFDVTGTTVSGATTKGKWILLKLDPELWFLTALETSGQILFHSNPSTLPEKYNLKLTFADNTYLTVRIGGWGFLHVVRDAELTTHFFTRKQGISPLDGLTYPTFERLLAEAPGMSVKEFFLDHTRVAGIGNGYLQEVLFRARVHPKRKVRDLRVDEQAALFHGMVAIINEATSLGGSEVDLFGQPGRYHKRLGLHVLGQPCPVCGTQIERIKFRGSSTYVCPACQPPVMATF